MQEEITHLLDQLEEKIKTLTDLGKKIDNPYFEVLRLENARYSQQLSLF